VAGTGGGRVRGGSASSAAGTRPSSGGYLSDARRAPHAHHEPSSGWRRLARGWGPARRAGGSGDALTSTPPNPRRSGPENADGRPHRTSNRASGDRVLNARSAEQGPRLTATRPRVGGDDARKVRGWVWVERARRGARCTVCLAGHRPAMAVRLGWAIPERRSQSAGFQ